MKTWSLLLGLLVSASVAAAVEARALPIIPTPSEWQVTGGGSWTPSGRLKVQSETPAAASVATRLEGDWLLLAGTVGRTGTCDRVELRLVDDPALGEEGYRLGVAADGVWLEAAARRGLFWATRSLLQLVKAGEPVPFGTIVDIPRYRVRSLMLDVGRKYFPLDYLRAIARELVWYKMNEFHVHLSDDVLFSNFRYAAFRLQCDGVPGLTAKDGSYTKAEFRAFVKECAEMGLNVVPEIDTPAHAGPLLDVRPDLRGGWHHLDLANPKTLPFVKGLWDEYLAGDDPVFAGPDVHVGTDEFGAAKPELFRAYADALFRHVRRYGKNPRAWGSFSHAPGQTPILADANIVIDLWHNKFYQPQAALAAGYSLISVPDGSNYIVPGASYYHDYLDVAGLYRTWTPNDVGGEKIDANHPRLLGGKFAIWNDLVGNGITLDDVFDRFLPAVQVIAEKTWAAASPRTWETFKAQAEKIGEAPGLNLADKVTLGADGRVDLTANRSVGWSQQGGWTVEFEIRPDAAPEPDAAIFADDFTTVKLSQGASGRFGFSRDGYDVTFDYVVPVGRWTRLKLSGTPRETSLWADGRLVKTFAPEKRYYPGEKRWLYAFYRTLHFPLVRAKTHAFRGEIRNLTCRLGAEKTLVGE